MEAPVSSIIVFFLSFKTKVIADIQSTTSYFRGIHIEAWVRRMVFLFYFHF